MMPNSSVENHLKGKETTVSNQNKENIVTPKQEKTTQDKISIAIDDDNSAIASSQDKTMKYSDDYTEETTKQTNVFDEQPELILWCKPIFMYNPTELGKVRLRLELSWGCDNSSYTITTGR